MVYTLQKIFHKKVDRWVLCTVYYWMNATAFLFVIYIVIVFTEWNIILSFPRICKRYVRRLHFTKTKNFNKSCLIQTQDILWPPWFSRFELKLKTSRHRKLSFMFTFYLFIFFQNNDFDGFHSFTPCRYEVVSMLST